MGEKRHKKRVWGIPATITLVVILVVVIGISCANVILTRVVNEQLANQVKALHNMRVSYDKIDVDLWRGSAFVKNLSYCSLPDTVLQENEPGFLIKADLAQFQFVNYWSYLRNKSIKIGKVAISNVAATVNYKNNMMADTKQEGMLVVNNVDTLMVTRNDSADVNKKKVSMPTELLKFVAAINVDNVVINNGSLKFKDLQSKMVADCDSLFLSVRNLGYDFEKDSIFYNDSVYNVSVKNICFIQPDGKYTLTVGEVSSEDANGVTIHNLSHVCNVPKEKLAEVNGKVPVVWSKININELKTSPVNIVRSVLNENIYVETVEVNGGDITLYQDKTYPFTTVQRPFQPLLAKLTMPLEVMHVKMKLDRFFYTFKSANLPPASLSMNSMDVDIKRISNYDLRDIVVLAKCSLDGGGGYMTMNIRLLKDDACTWRNRMIIENANLAAFNGFLGSLAGAEVSGHLTRLESYAVGDTMVANGRFVMEYDNLQAKIVKGKSPIKALNDNSKVINGLIKVMIPPANPSKPGMEPKSFKVKANRNLYAPYFVYMMGPVFSGLKETMLSPLYLNKEIKDGKGVYSNPTADTEKKYHKVLFHKRISSKEETSAK